jgi:hypothetical protein
MINKKITLLLTSSLLSVAVWAQDRAPLHGRVLVSGAAAKGIFIINKVTGDEVRSEADGSFAIPARVGDKLAVYSKNTDVREFAINNESFKAKPYTIEVDAKATELKEVVINDVNEETLGLVPKGQKQRTPAERRLYTAKSGIGLDLLINVLSGRLKMLEKALDTERKEQLMAALDGIFTDEELTQFGVSRDMARGFLYYAVEDQDMADAIHSKNQDRMKLVLMQLSEKYNKLQNQHE